MIAATIIAEVRRREAQDRLLAECAALDDLYASAAAFDDAVFDEWLRSVAEVLCKRTEYPKLGYIIDRLNAEGIASALHGRSFHAEHMLWVRKDASARAWQILDEQMNGVALDEVDDDDPRFAPFANRRPDPDLWEAT